MSLFAVAVLIATVLFADRLGSADEVRRRFYQVGLAFVAVLFVFALAAVIVPVPDQVAEESSFGQEDEDAGGVLRERLSIIVGLGLLILIGGMYQSATYATISLGFMLGGLVLLISSVSDAGSSSLLQFYYELELDAGDEKNAVYAAVTGIGLAVMLAFGLREWDRPALDLDTANADSTTG